MMSNLYILFGFTHNATMFHSSVSNVYKNHIASATWKVVYKNHSASDIWKAEIWKADVWKVYFC